MYTAVVQDAKMEILGEIGATDPQHHSHRKGEDSLWLIIINLYTQAPRRNLPIPARTDMRVTVLRRA
jgi:hypothetical protein